jgi:hypothetical protein
MASIVVNGDTSGAVTLSAPAVAGTVTVTLPSASGTMAVSGGSPSFASLTVTGDALIDGLTVGQGGGNVSSNTAVGASALSANTTGNTSTAVGSGALQNNTTGAGNTAVGQAAMQTNTTANYNDAFGWNVLNANTSGSSNAGFGNRALSANTTGTNNTGIGVVALGANTTGSNNTAVGLQALSAVTTAGNNTAVGYNAMAKTLAGSCTAVGYAALYNQTSPANFNDAFGYQALYALTTGNVNLAVGCVAGQTVTTGGGNILLGYNSGQNLTTGATNVHVSYAGISSSASVSNEILIGGNSSTGKGANTGFINPAGGNYQGSNSSSWATTSDRRLKKNIVDNTEGLDVISQIRVRNFEYRTAEEITELPAHTVIDKQGVQLGVIAQELQEVCPDCVKTETTGVISVDSDNIFWHMVNAIKDLKAELDTVKAELAALKG